MNIEIVAIADHAQDYNGKLVVLGAFDSIIAPSFPTQYPHCSIAIRQRFTRAEEGEHLVRVLMIDSDGRQHGTRIDGKTNVVVPPDQESVAINLVLGINGLPFPSPGVYHVDVAVDGQHVSRLPISVKAVQQHRIAA
jgi:hypothetical protein